MNCTTFTADGQPDLLNDPAAQLIDAGKTLDFVEIDAASHTWVDNIREEIIDKALYPPVHLKKKVYVIDEVHMLSKGAFNALLKIMEEPPSYLIFILATTELHKVPDTIASRCQVFNFKHLTIDEITGRLVHIATQEKIPYQESALRLIAKLSSWALRDAIKYLEQISILGEVTEEHVATFLGVVSDRLLQQAMELLQGNDPHAWIAFLDTIISQWVDLQNFAKEILMWLDEHFMEQPTRFAQLAGMMREIIAESKRYPHPLLLWKAKTWHWFGDTTSSYVIPKHTNNPTQTTQSQPAASHQSSTGSSSSSNNNQAVNPPTSSSSDAVEGSHDDSASSWVTGEQASPPSTTSDVSPSSPSPLSPELIIETLLSGTTNPMLKSALKQNVIIQEITPETIGAIVINEQFYHTISKPDISHDLEKTLHSQLWFSGQIKRTYMTKEERLVRQMG